MAGFHGIYLAWQPLLVVIVTLSTVVHCALDLCGNEHEALVEGSISYLQYPNWIDAKECQCQLTSEDAQQLMLHIHLKSSYGSPRDCQPKFSIQQTGGQEMLKCSSSLTNATLYMNLKPHRPLSLTLTNMDRHRLKFYIQFKAISDQPVNITCTAGVVVPAVIPNKVGKVLTGSKKGQIATIVCVVLILFIIAIVILLRMSHRCKKDESLNRSKEHYNDTLGDNPGFTPSIAPTPKSSMYDITAEKLYNNIPPIDTGPPPLTGMPDLGASTGLYPYHSNPPSTRATSRSASLYGFDYRPFEDKPDPFTGQADLGVPSSLTPHNSRPPSTYGPSLNGSVNGLPYLGYNPNPYSRPYSSNTPRDTNPAQIEPSPYDAKPLSTMPVSKPSPYKPGPLGNDDDPKGHSPQPVKFMNYAYSPNAKPLPGQDQPDGQHPNQYSNGPPNSYWPPSQETPITPQQIMPVKSQPPTGGSTGPIYPRKPHANSKVPISASSPSPINRGVYPPPFNVSFDDIKFMDDDDEDAWGQIDTNFRGILRLQSGGVEV